MGIKMKKRGRAASSRLGNGLYDYSFLNKKTALMLAAFCIGMFLGVSASQNKTLAAAQQIQKIFESFFTMRSSQTFLVTMANSFFSSALFLLFSFIFGLCVVGIPFLILTPAVKGIGIGLVSGYLYSAFSLKGIGYCALVIFPGMLVSVFALVYACSEAFQMSYCVWSSATGSSGRRSGGNIKNYIAKYVLMLLIIILAAAIDGAAAKAFGGLFTFSA